MTLSLGVGSVLGVGIGAMFSLNVIAMATTPPAEQPMWRNVTVPTQPCQTEDQLRPSCYWDAGTRGDGRGYSFWTYGETRHYLTPGPRPRLAPRPGFRRFRNVDGHTHCWINVGDTSLIRCGDGYATTS